jgi:pilus assembly protein Flp/PilA
MSTMDVKQCLRNLLTDDSGQDLIEYALIAAIVGLAAATAMRAFKISLSNTFSGIGSSLTDAI